jgi:hypothetical protein
MGFVAGDRRPDVPARGRLPVYEFSGTDAANFPEETKLGVSDSLDFRRERAQFAFKTDRAPESHGLSNIASGACGV